MSRIERADRRSDVDAGGEIGQNSVRRAGGIAGVAANVRTAIVRVGLANRLLDVRSASSSLAQVTGPQQPTVGAIVVRALWQQGIEAHEPPWAISGTRPETAIITTATINARNIVILN
jgi:hypothetical protein